MSTSGADHTPTRLHARTAHRRGAVCHLSPAARRPLLELREYLYIGRRATSAEPSPSCVYPPPPSYSAIFPGIYKDKSDDWKPSASFRLACIINHTNIVAKLELISEFANGAPDNAV